MLQNAYCCRIYIKMRKIRVLFGFGIVCYAIHRISLSLCARQIDYILLVADTIGCFIIYIKFEFTHTKNSEDKKRKRKFEERCQCIWHFNPIYKMHLNIHVMMMTMTMAMMMMMTMAMILNSRSLYNLYCLCQVAWPQRTEWCIFAIENLLSKSQVTFS